MSRIRDILREVPLRYLIADALAFAIGASALIVGTPYVLALLKVLVEGAS